MKKPKLQVALDHSTMEEAVVAAVAVGAEVDIIEAGTVCLLETGTKTIEILRQLFPGKTIVADAKCADAGGTVARNCKRAGANYMTCICSAQVATMQAAAKEIEIIQVELYGDWTYEQAQEWLDSGINHVIYHQSRDALLAGGTWGERDLDQVKSLIDMGFHVSVTGGLSVETLAMFEGVDVDTFIAGRAITEAKHPVEAARAFQAKIMELWGD